MIFRLLTFLVIGFGLYFLWRWKQADTREERRKLVLNALFWGLLGVILILAATGRIHWLGAAFAGVLVAIKQMGILLLRWFPMLAGLYGKHRQSNANAGNSSDGSLSISEASKILGINPEASIDEIKKAHRSQIRKQHPDHGGNAYFAAKLNEARDVLIASRKAQG